MGELFFNENQSENSDHQHEAAPLVPATEQNFLHLLDTCIGNELNQEHDAEQGKCKLYEFITEKQSQLSFEFTTFPTLTENVYIN